MDEMPVAETYWTLRRGVHKLHGARLLIYDAACGPSYVRYVGARLVWTAGRGWCVCDSASLGWSSRALALKRYEAWLRVEANARDVDREYVSRQEAEAIGVAIDMAATW